MTLPKWHLVNFVLDDRARLKWNILTSRPFHFGIIYAVSVQLHFIIYLNKIQKSLTLKAPDKEFYAAQKNEDMSRLNDAKIRRENQFKDKRIIDSELREVNQQVGAKVLFCEESMMF